MNFRLGVRTLSRVLALAGLCCLGWWARTEWTARAYQSAESARLDATRALADREWVVVAALVEDSPRSGLAALPALHEQVLGRLEIPRLRIRAIVAEGVDETTLGRAVGHVTNTALPGRPGNCALAGHRDTFLRGLGDVRIRDTIRIVTGERSYAYRVEWTAVVAPRRIDVLAPTPESCVTLVTCYPFGYIGHAPNRFIVRARLVDESGANEAGAP